MLLTFNHLFELITDNILTFLFIIDIFMVKLLWISTYNVFLLEIAEVFGLLFILSFLILYLNTLVITILQFFNRSGREKNQQLLFTNNVNQLNSVYKYISIYNFLNRTNKNLNRKR